jgi:hypothetical protein
MLLLQASKEAVLRQIGEAECIHLATHMSWKLSAIVLSPGGDMVDSQHSKRFFASSAASSSGGIAGQTASITGVPATSDQGDEEGSEVSTYVHRATVHWLHPQLLQYLHKSFCYYGQNILLHKIYCAFWMELFCQLYSALLYQSFFPLTDFTIKRKTIK